MTGWQNFDIDNGKDAVMIVVVVNLACNYFLDDLCSLLVNCLVDYSLII